MDERLNGLLRFYYQKITRIPKDFDRSLRLIGKIYNIRLLVLLSKLEVVKLLGIRWVAWRLFFALRLRMGQVERKTPVQKWDKVAAPKFTGKCILNEVKDENIIPLAKRILRGKHLYFFHHHFSSEILPDWLANPFGKKKFDRLNTVHWSKISDFDQGDIKCIWELSRFAWAYPLSRAYSLTNDESFSSAFWQLVEDWVQKNPPNKGVHWKCGQEITIRMLALVTAYFAFKSSKRITDERARMVRQVLYASTKRIEANIGYALSQNNNHGISEATGLFTGGVLFGDKDWINKGRCLLESQVLDLVYADGSFSQHSANYHRMLIHACLWAVQLGRINGIDFSEEFIGKIRKAGKWLLAIYDPKTGRMPNLGSNDGALILPYSNCDYLDFRPTIQTVGAVVDGNRWLSAGPWDDMALWLVPDTINGAYTQKKRNATKSLKPQKNKAQICLFRDGGYAILKHENTKLIFRCPQQFSHRPAQCDLLHLDLWHNGINYLRDAGTYSYNCEQHWQNYFKSVVAHNTVQFDDHDQMPKISRFLYGKWPKLSAVIDSNSTVTSTEAEFTDWKGCRHKRRVEIIGDTIRVTDIISGYHNKAVLRWRLAPEFEWHQTGNRCSGGECHIKLQTETGYEELSVVAGWESLYYQQKSRIQVFEMTVIPPCKRIVTEISFNE